MEIERNAGASINTPYPFDIRLLDESGKVIKSSNGNDGLIPVPTMEYEQMLLNARPELITERLLYNDDVVAQVGRVDGDEVYHVSEELLESEEPLPQATYITDESEFDDIGQRKVIMGKHSGRIVVEQDEWEKMSEGRASGFVPEDELEPFDVDSETGDLRLPKPKTDRSSLQTNDTFWKYISKKFVDRYDDEIERWRQELQSADDIESKLKNMNAKTVADITGGRDA
jgi:hypothetical protein